MVTDLLDALLVLVALLVCYGVPTWYATRLWSHPGGLLDRVARALTLGLCSQAVLGLLWAKVVRTMPGIEPLAYLALWVAVSVVVRLRRVPAPPSAAVDRGLLLAWLGLIAAGIGWRWVHPLTHSALGQSDAYSHLMFIWDVIESGKIRNQIYPSGYHWVLALPCLVLKIDPYLAARYGGAFSAVLLMLSVGSIVGAGPRSRGGVMAAVLIAFFPGFVLLAKTGVGAFPNQLGLVMIVAVLRCWLAVTAAAPGTGRAEAVALSIFMMGLAAMVPLMLVTVAMCIAAERLAALWIDRTAWWRRIAVLVAAGIPVLCLVLVQFMLVSAGWRVASVSHVVHQESVQKVADNVPEKRGIMKTLMKSPYAGLVVDFLTVKRFGMKSWPLDAASVVMGISFFVALGIGLRLRAPPVALLGFWGLLCTIQTATGLFQFTNYQRAGWMLLICAAWIGGLIYDGAGRFLPRRAYVALTVIGVAACLALSARFIPRHVNIMSSAEDDIVDVLRQVAIHGPRDSGGPRWIRASRPSPAPFLDVWNPERRLRIVMREVSVFRGQMGEILPAVLGPFRRADVYSVGWERDVRGIVRADSQSMILIDKFAPLSRHGIQVAAQMGLGIGNRYPDGRKAMYRRNDQMMDVLNDLDKEAWTITAHSYSPRLSILFVERTVP